MKTKKNCNLKVLLKACIVSGFWILTVHGIVRITLSKVRNCYILEAYSLRNNKLKIHLIKTTP
jgi:hypothetical protein